jgi:hypothetical protein
MPGTITDARTPAGPDTGYQVMAGAVAALARELPALLAGWAARPGDDEPAARQCAAAALITIDHMAGHLALVRERLVREDPAAGDDAEALLERQAAEMTDPWQSAGARVPGQVTRPGR